MAELRSPIQSVYNVTDGNSMVAYNLVVDHQVHTGALMSSDDQIVVQLTKTVGDVVEQLAFNSDTLIAAYATSGNAGLIWNISGTTAILQCASGAAWKNEDIIISATINNIVVDKERISYSSSTPILELSNDVGSLMYSADGTTKLKNDEIATTNATVYVNGNAVPTAQVQFNWNIIDGVGTSSANTVTVSAINLNAFKAQAVCTATFNNISYQKVFKVMRNTQGIAGVDGKPGTDGKPGADANIIEVFDIYFWRSLDTAKIKALPSIPSTRKDVVDTSTVAADTWTTEMPTKATNRLIYHSVVTWTKKGATTETLDWAVTNPNLILAYDGNNMLSPESYAQYLTLTNFDQNAALGWSDSGALYIKADYIQSKGILVKKGENILLAAGGDGIYKEAVQIAGFVVNDHAFYNTAELGLSGATYMTAPNDTDFTRLPNTNYIYIGTNGIGLVHTGEASGETPIEKQVYLMGGQIFANSGTIGGWSIDSTALYHEADIGLENGHRYVLSMDEEGNACVAPDGVWDESTDGDSLRLWVAPHDSEGQPVMGEGAIVPFVVTKNGSLYASNARIRGTVFADAGVIGGIQITPINLTQKIVSTTKKVTVNVTIPAQTQGTVWTFPKLGVVFGGFKVFNISSTLNIPEDATFGEIQATKPLYPDDITNLDWGTDWAEVTSINTSSFVVTANRFIKSGPLSTKYTVAVDLAYTYYQVVSSLQTSTKFSSIDGTFSIITKDNTSILQNNISNIQTLVCKQIYGNKIISGDAVIYDGGVFYNSARVYFANSATKKVEATLINNSLYVMIYLSAVLDWDKTFQIQYKTQSSNTFLLAQITVPAGRVSASFDIIDGKCIEVQFVDTATSTYSFTSIDKRDANDAADFGNGLLFDSMPILPVVSNTNNDVLTLNNIPGASGGRLGGKFGNIIQYRWWNQAYIHQLYICKIISPDNGGTLNGIWRYYKPSGQGLEIRQTNHITTESQGVRIGDPFIQFWSMEGNSSNTTPTSLLSIYEEYNSDKIQTGQIKQDSLIVFNAPNRLLSFRGTSNNDHSNTFYGNWYFSNGQVGFGRHAYFEKTTTFTGAATFKDTVYNTQGNTVFTSSRLSKTNIGTFNDKHEILFNSLLPKQFVYKEGARHRLHYGFILDEVGAALQKAGLTTQECAAYCLDDLSNPNGDGGLRYGEFIALNTWQIQLLKPRVSDLEQRCATLEARVKELENKYENIQ